MGYEDRNDMYTQYICSMHIMLCNKLVFSQTIHNKQMITEADEVDAKTTLPTNLKEILKNANASEVKRILNNTRRIIAGTQASASRPYMYKDYRRWLCGGVIIHEEYILTSAACIEDAKHFYIVSGTSKHDERDDRYNNVCIKNGAKKAIWKCIPRNYVFDGHENDNIRWMNNDIAVVRVDEEFDFTRRVRGCEFIPKPICYNNQSSKLEEDGNQGSIAGRNLGTRAFRSKCQTYFKENMQAKEKYVDCTDVMYSDESGETRRKVLRPSEVAHSANHTESGRRTAVPGSGGFCENDHGGPLIHGKGVNALVIGIISACLVKDRTNRCYGPFLYTSVFKNKNLISCAIYKDVAYNDNIRWMNNDIAVVKIEDGFDFERRIRGCDFVPRPICYNNQSQTLENPGTVVTIAGWGTTSRYNDEKYVDCQEINYSDEEDARRGAPHTEKVPTNLIMHPAFHNELQRNTSIDSRRSNAKVADGGFCENDHGGPLVYGTGVNAIVIGLISACLVKERSNKCYGPFLYTSIYKNRQYHPYGEGFIVEESSGWFLFYSYSVIYSPAKNEMGSNDTKVEEAEVKEAGPEIVLRTNEADVNATGDKVFAGSGFVLRSANNDTVLNHTKKVD
ncbi:Uncharacterized protein OBRU01_13348 [Operophtera brumata]|uniref:Peptidase S1 domain-containing protein n=1 Tax=Operophtera brumata TaxID=104452 RepID=A0A0L7L8S3_OPEBR|nr:Uncharacterized protein OBRU01_13348 [Operophtera brumata]